MNNEIERLAIEAGLRWLIKICGDVTYYTVSPEQLAKFAALVAEECAKECEAMPNEHYDGYGADGSEFAAAIRAKFALSHKTPEAK